ncbi:TetR-like C-terminal domain-containing protein [Novosphingobium sp. Rr 2-17]|uniref:TetR-like C-terminal domain-containing protein n=1 Tax=Novosphingobium sp. Rr 2-17 TaxID=555793 RepID=UPI001ED8FFC0|nr:TetR-like C-terminal domain-containing protein [Novosphingobium sp. Rr 2-17]
MNVDGLVMAVNTHTFALWTQWLEARLEAAAGAGRIDVLIEGYFGFAAAHPNLWSAIYEHRLSDGMELPERLAEERGQLMQVVSREVRAILPQEKQDGADRLARSLVATVHGHCSFALGGSFALMGETNPLELARDRVTEILAANGRIGGPS